MAPDFSYLYFVKICSAAMKELKFVFVIEITKKRDLPPADPFSIMFWNK
jgi:hypothetical protein